MAATLFYTHGKFCASHPWEVIMATLTVITCMLTLERQNPQSLKVHPDGRTIFLEDMENNGAATVVITVISCFTVLHSFYQFNVVCNMGSKYILVIASLFTIFSFTFTWIVINFFATEALDLKEILFLFLFLIDVTKVGKLAQFALYGLREEVTSNIATGLTLFAPCVMLDTIIELLIISVGSLSGLPKLEPFLYSASLTIIVNCLTLLIFYPAYLSLILGLSSVPKVDTVIIEFQKLNPVVQRVKSIMCGGLLFVHLNSRSSFKNYLLFKVHGQQTNDTETDTFSNNLTEYSFNFILLLIIVTMFALFDSDQKTFLISKKCSQDKVIQTELIQKCKKEPARSLEECLSIYGNKRGIPNLTDEEVILLVENKHLSVYQIEKAVDDTERGVKIRRQFFAKFSAAIQNLPYKNYNYQNVLGACCENVIGYIPVPLGIVGPLLLDGHLIYIPMATTEGCLVASTNRGCHALLKTGIISRVVSDGMTRGPVVRFPSIVDASDVKAWLEKTENFGVVKASFDSSSRFARLIKVQVRIAGRYLFIRFVAKTGDAMGMNMLSKGTESALNCMQSYFPNMKIVSLSGNFCTDKKPSAVNWIEGRGKSVVCEGIVPARTVTSLLKTSVHALVDVNISKNLIGSAVAGSMGGFNAHASNIVTAIFIATGQDPAQNVTSSSCITLMEPWGKDGNDLYISCTMPSIEIGTVGGGTVLSPQAACLDILGVKGSHSTSPGENANKLARIVCGAVLAGELSLMAALTAGHVVKSHLKYNRSFNCSQ